MENCDEKAKVLASKYLFKKPWLTVRQENRTAQRRDCP